MKIIEKNGNWASSPGSSSRTKSSLWRSLQYARLDLSNHIRLVQNSPFHQGIINSFKHNSGEDAKSQLTRIRFRINYVSHVFYHKIRLNRFFVFEGIGKRTPLCTNSYNNLWKGVISPLSTFLGRAETLHCVYIDVSKQFSSLFTRIHLSQLSIYEKFHEDIHYKILI